MKIAENIQAIWLDLPVSGDQTQDRVEIGMRSLLSVATLISIALPAYADFVSIPEPNVLSLIGIGALAVLLGRRGKK